MRHAAFLLVLLLLPACSPLQQLKSINPSADDFNSALASEYLAYADSESEQGRFFTSEHYAGKGLKAYKGQPVGLDAPDATLPAADQRELADGRAKLTVFMTDDMKRVAPQKLARAQLLFDCWQYEVARRLDREMAPCDDEFRSAIVDLQEVGDSLTYGSENAYPINFARGSAKLDDAAAATIQSVADIVKPQKNYRVELQAYLGRGQAQRSLSEARLHAVRDALVKSGVLSKRVRLRKHGGAKAVILSRDKNTDATQIVITVKTNTHREQ